MENMPALFMLPAQRPAVWLLCTHAGSVLFVPAGTKLTLSSSEPLLVWVAAVNGTFFALADALAGVATAAVVEALAATTNAIANTTDVIPGPDTATVLAEQPAAPPVVQPVTAVAVA
jgi:hypothetical protein